MRWEKTELDPGAVREAARRYGLDLISASSLLRRGLVLQDGDLTLFFTRPISFVMFLLVAGTVAMSIPAVSRHASRAWSGLAGAWRRGG